MDLSVSQYVQLIVGLVFVVLAFLAAYAGPEKAVVALLLLMIPFQLVTSRYGSVNTGLAYIVFVAFLLNGRIRKMPIIAWVGLLVFAYLISLSQAHRATYFDHGLYLLAIGANVAIFYIVFNYIFRTRDIRSFFNLMVWLNILVDLYCYTQLLLGFESTALFGVSELSVQQNREDARLAGPFTAVGITAEYLVIQTYMLLYMQFHERGKKRKLVLLSVIAANMAFLVATGNRGGVFVLLLGGLIFFFLFRKEFGVAKLFRRGLLGAALFGVMAFIVIGFTQFNVLLERLTQTEIREGVPDTRAVIWPFAWERIQDKPVAGHGPRIRLIEELKRRIPGHEFMPYPHSTYLFILYTMGVIGFLAYGVFLFALVYTFWKRKDNKCEDAFVRGIPRLGLLILTIVVIDQLKVSMFRFNLADYQQYVSAVFGGLLAGSYLAANQKLKKTVAEFKTKKLLRESRAQ